MGGGTIGVEVMFAVIWTLALAANVGDGVGSAERVVSASNGLS
jgi:hypothetical protein